LDSSEIAPSARQHPSLRTNLLRLLALVVVVAITIFVYSIREHVRAFAILGYPGIFLVALLANATVLLPAPGVAFVFAMGSILHPLGIAVAAGTGGALGELTGFLAGVSGQAVIERTDVYARISPWVTRYGGWAILFLAAIPNPFFDLAGIAAGMSGMSVWRFLLFCWIGQIIKMGLFAYAGAHSINWFSGIIH
jgi:uncharacterized membrane protein YdjX (TVP38/TMEM64 family)